MRHCAQCNGRLVLIGEVTEKVEGSRTPVTTEEYRCLDDVCQARIDKETALRIKSRDERQKKLDARKLQGKRKPLKTKN